MKTFKTLLISSPTIEQLMEAVKKYFGNEPVHFDNEGHVIKTNTGRKLDNFIVKSKGKRKQLLYIITIKQLNN